MRGKIVLIVAGVLALMLFGWRVVWPMIDQELLKVPMTDGISALRAKNVHAMRQCFTPEATLRAGEWDVPVSTVLDALEPALAGLRDRDMGSFHFAGYANQRRHGKTVEADFTLVFTVRSSENPYRGGIPIRRQGHVVLAKQGLLSWKIARVEISDAELREAVESVGVLTRQGGR